MRNRFTIDTDIVFDGDVEQDLASPPEHDSNRPQQDEPEQQQHSELAGDTDRWVEEQFDLEEYEDQDEVKETDILSDDDEEFCQTPRAASVDADLEAPVMALSLEGEETNESASLQTRVAGETPDDAEPSRTEKPSATTDDDIEEQTQTEGDEIWVRRKQSGLSPGCDI